MVSHWFVWTMYTLIAGACALLIPMEIRNAWRAVYRWVGLLGEHPKLAIVSLWAAFWESWLCVGTVAGLLIGAGFVPQMIGYGTSKACFILANTLFFARLSVEEKLHGKKGSRKHIAQRAIVTILLLTLFIPLSLIECGMVRNVGIGAPPTLHNIWIASLWWSKPQQPVATTIPHNAKSEEPSSIQPPPASSSTEYQEKPFRPKKSFPAEPLDVRGERLCHEILDFAKDAQEEEPIIAFGTRDPIALQTETINQNNFHMRMNNDFEKRFRGRLSTILPEFKEKGIEPELCCMGDPPDFPHMAHLDGNALCTMVSQLRVKESIPDVEAEEKVKNYRSLGFCTGRLAADDPLPDEKNEQLGVHAIHEADLIEDKADRCLKTILARGKGPDDVRQDFGSDMRSCCIEGIQKIHYAILSRCPTARESSGETAFSLFLQYQASYTKTPPPCDVDDLAKYLRELGQTMKDLRDWRPIR